MFSKAQASSMDLEELGRELKQRKLELLGEEGSADEQGDMSGAARGRRGGRELRARSS
jgi:hypothetical protein